MKKSKSSVVDSSLKVVESKDSSERTQADLKVPDPKPERAQAILEGNKSNE